VFSVPADAYDRFMGRYSVPLAPKFADHAGVSPGQQVVDVGCGPGALTAVLVERLGASAVAAADPSEPFVEAMRARQPGVDVRRAPAEDLPFDDDAFDAALAQLVVHFMADPVAGLREMRRLTRPDGIVAANVWSHGEGRGPLSPFWKVVHELDPGARDESGLAGSRQGQLEALFEEAGMREVEESALSVEVEHETFDEWWAPYELGVGPAGAYVAQLDEHARMELREACRERLPDAPFVMEAQAWTAVGRA
jgi:SAM-dependent methyltransferase